MKNQTNKIILSIPLFVTANNAFPTEISKYIHFETVINDVTNSNNLNIVIIGMIILIIILVGAVIFTKKQ